MKNLLMSNKPSLFSKLIKVYNSNSYKLLYQQHFLAKPEEIINNKKKKLITNFYVCYLQHNRWICYCEIVLFFYDCNFTKNNFAFAKILRLN